MNGVRASLHEGPRRRPGARRNTPIPTGRIAEPRPGAVRRRARRAPHPNPGLPRGPHDPRRDRGLCPLALHPREEGGARPGPPGRPRRAGGAQARRRGGASLQGHRGSDRRLRLPGGRAGLQRRPADRDARRPRPHRGRRHGEPLLRLIHAVGPHGRRADRARGGGGLPLRRRGEHEPRADDGLQPPAQPGAPREAPRRLHGDGRYRRERRPPLGDFPGRPGGLRGGEPPQGGAGARRGTARRRDRADRHQGRPRRGRRLHPRRRQRRGPRRPQARLPAGRHGDRRHRLAADRRRLGGAGVQRGLCPPRRPDAAGPDRRRGHLGLRAGGHGHRPRGGLPEGHGPGRDHRRRPERGGADEAFASQALACIRDLGLREETVNIDGGAIALGHPLGATGARIVGKAAALLAREGGRFALATQCIGGGQGIATLLERV